MCFFFFFQAEDGIRDTSVTGVQTCALPICVRPYLHAGPVSRGVIFGRAARSALPGLGPALGLTLVCLSLFVLLPLGALLLRRSEERRVGKECRSRRAA